MGDEGSKVAVTEVGDNEGSKVAVSQDNKAPLIGTEGSRDGGGGELWPRPLEQATPPPPLEATPPRG